MPVSSMSLFFALLALAANAVVVGWVVLTLARRSPTAARLGQRVDEELAGSTTGFAAVVAAVATAGSLYYSEVAHFVPAYCAGCSVRSCTPSRACWPWRRGAVGRCAARHAPQP